ncbi:uncharacterized protein METZ01_LOCUS276918, partial [marine metagenome]
DLFKLKTTFNDDISNWDVSNVINMSEMFESADAFNINISAWDVSSVTDMYAMFHSANSFNGDISTWDVSSVTDMSYFFRYASNFNQDLSNWDVSSVINMTRMFVDAASFNGDVSTWDVSSVTDMTDMFEGAEALSDANKCFIHGSFQSNDAWPYDWSDLCESAGYTYVPDDNFEQALIDLGYDDTLDNYVVTDSINSVTYLDVSNDSISDLTGIENFIALTNFYIDGNQLTSLDISSNTALMYLGCSENQLTSLDVSNNTQLFQIICSINQLTSLDVSNNTSLAYLTCHSNQLTSIDLSNNTALTAFWGNGNQLTSLDLSNNTALTGLDCGGNQLTYLNMKNGVTDALTTFNATNNDSLECIETLNPDYATTNWTYENGNIDEGVSFAIQCVISNLHVATTGSDSTGDGTYENPFATI